MPLNDTFSDEWDKAVTEADDAVMVLDSYDMDRAAVKLSVSLTKLTILSACLLAKINDTYGEGFIEAAGRKARDEMLERLHAGGYKIPGEVPFS